MTDDDEAIRAALRAAHVDDEPPLFRHVPAPRRSPAPLVALAAVIAAAIVWVAWPRSSTTRSEPPVASYAIPELDSPTDFLLTTPGAELLTTTPTFDVVTDVTKGSEP
jgi:hypothetical protein